MKPTIDEYQAMIKAEVDNLIKGEHKHMDATVKFDLANHLKTYDGDIEAFRDRLREQLGQTVLAMAVDVLHAYWVRMRTVETVQ